MEKRGQDKEKNRIYVVGIGSGSEGQITRQAQAILGECDVIIGYTVYVDLLKGWLPGKEYLTTPMTQEVERCRMAFEEAKKGKRAEIGRAHV